MSYSYNKIAETRPDSTFANFVPQNDEQAAVAQRLQTIADQLIAKGDDILKQEFPFRYGKIFFLWGKPGRGKTHLVEAFINHLRKGRKDLMKKTVLARGRFYYDFQLEDDPFKVPIVIIDDMFHDHQSVNSLHRATDIPAVMRFLTMVYEKRAFVLVTSNFAMKEGILRRVKEVDEVGRALSRAQEIFAGSGEVELTGRDYREVMAEGRSDDDFIL